MNPSLPEERSDRLYIVWFLRKIFPIVLAKGGIFVSIFDEIGEAIIYLRKQRGFTQEGLALECGISVSYLRMIEHGDANPTINELWRIAEVLDVELRNPFVVPVAAGMLS